MNDEQFHDGTSIGVQLDITRAAVWKMLKKLQSYGVALESVKGRGYRLKKPIFLLNNKKIKANCNHKKIQVEVFEKLPSTNAYLKNNSDQNLQNIKVCIAETQTQGKGRLNRSWHSPFGENIYFSMSYSFQKDLSELPGLSLVIALAACKAIDVIIPRDENPLLIKWPNDILIDQQKLAGILIEAQAESNGFCRIVVGIGINVNMEQVDEEFIQPWTSLLQVTSKYHDRNPLCAALIDAIVVYLKQFSTHGLASFRNEWEKRDFLCNRVVTLASSNIKNKGICMGINENGCLLLKHEDGTIHAYSAGDTTLS